jgi:SAM-dependent methyltransferase
VLFELLKVLDELYFEQVGGSSEQPSSFVTETKKLYALANGPDRDALVKHMGNRNTFAAYHREMKRVNDAWQTQSAAPVHQIADEIWSDLVRNENRKPQLIVDAGCGLGELAEILFQKEKSHDYGPTDLRVKMIVIGLDAPSKDVWHEVTDQKWIKDERVMYASGDYSSSTYPAQANFFVYSLSLLRNDITRDIETALNALQHKGILFIAEMRHRFPSDFTEVMKLKGFAQMRQSNLTARNTTFTFYVFFKHGPVNRDVKVVLRDAYPPVRTFPFLDLSLRLVPLHSYIAF